MLTGRRPFGGDTPAEVLSAIIKDEPRPIDGVPRELAKLIRRCLAKDPKKRLQTALDVHNELEELKVDWSSGELQKTAPPTSRVAPGKWIALAALLSVVVIALLYVARRPTDSVLRLANPLQVTRDAGVEDHPTWSPDGDMIAYQNGLFFYESSGDIW